MAKKTPTTTESYEAENPAFKDYIFPELGFKVKARTLKEAEAKAEEKLRSVDNG